MFSDIDIYLSFHFYILRNIHLKLRSIYQNVFFLVSICVYIAKIIAFQLFLILSC